MIQASFESREPQLLRGVPKDCIYDTRVYSDANVFFEEMDKLFGHVWMALGHICELDEPGRYLCSDIGGTPVVVVRDDQGHYRGFVNADSRGRQIVPGAAGKLDQFQTVEDVPDAEREEYSLAGVPIGSGGAFGLQPIAVEVRMDFVYGSLNPIEPIESDLGPELDWWSEIIRSDVPWRLDTVFTFNADCNWKAFIQPGDGYHVQALHEIFSRAMMPKEGFCGSDLVSRGSATHAHTLFAYPPPDYPRFRKSVWGGVTGPDEVEIPQLCRVPTATVGGYIGVNFPNYAFLTRNGWNLKIIQVLPRAPERSTVVSKVYVRADLTPEQRRIVEHEEDIWGYPMGLNGQDDLANFEWQQRALRGDTLPEMLASRYVGEDPNARTMPVRPDSEATFRAYYRRWQRFMQSE